MQIPFLDLKSQYQSIQDEVDAAMQEVLNNCSYVLGPQVERFEEQFAEYCGTRHCVTVGSGLEALTLALMAMGIAQGDEVIVQANSFVASALAVTRAGGTPVMADCRDRDYLLDASRIESLVTPRTKAVMPVHLHGRLGVMEQVLEVAERHGLAVLEDSAQAHGAEVGGRRAGSLGLAGCFSFYPGKNLGAYGDGGAVTTNDAGLAEKLRRLRNYGSSVKYRHEDLGTNTRLDSIQAAVLGVKLRHLDGWNQARRERAAWYDELLTDVPVVRPPLHQDKEHVWHLYVIRTPHRDALLDHLHANGVMSQIHYPLPIHLQECYRGKLTAPGSLPVSEAHGPAVLSLPIFAELTRQQAEYVADTVRRFFEAPRDRNNP